MPDPIDFLAARLARLEVERQAALRRGDPMTAIGITRRKLAIVGVVLPVEDGMTERFDD
jgi:hypothetical protein